MCLLLTTPNKAAIDVRLLKNAYDHNSDGWGVMWAENGRVHHFKQKAGWEKFKARWENEVPSELPLVVHFRFGTSGGKTDQTCHPFKVLSLDDGDPMDLYLAHNGVLNGQDYPSKAGHSDTMEYVDTIIEQLKLAPALLQSPAWIAAQENLTSGSKMVLLAGDGTVTYFNKQSGDTRADSPGVWFSNLHSLREVFSGHGSGKRAVDTQEPFDFTSYQTTNLHNYSGGYYGGTTHSIAEADAMVVQAAKMPWLYDKEKNHWWKPTKSFQGIYVVYIGMRRDAKTGRFERHWGDGDWKISPPGHNSMLKVQISDVAAFEAGGYTKTSFTDGEMRVEVRPLLPAPGKVLDLRDSGKEPLELVLTDEDRAAAPTPAEIEEALDAQARDRDPGMSEDELAAVQWSDHELAKLDERQMQDLIWDDVENAAIWIGARLNRPWAFEQEDSETIGLGVG